MKIKLLLVMLAIAFTTIASKAQSLKFGHINTAELLALMPEVKKADSTLQAYQKYLEELNQSLLVQYQQQIADYQTKLPTLTPELKEIYEVDIKATEQKIQDFQESAPDKFSNKKEEIYGPILKKAEDAIKEVAKEKGYAYVFDMSAGGVIYAQDSDNLMDLVKAKLLLK